ncbi:MAG: hypothetical protein GTO45_10510, partial [Candidatus Aminicenantes bacterium]|nr:hypothetical protein [Candidatus Aminicenantes bacterium]NIM79239.1 hypothetical protein [Candidatus Aminicenantes bacterium]NIN18517.1 hypothetical protein [Candidatus Aminicenantes bacterium]NIN42413.1 hypothetical protein [Candidatus Aminicenantes bacterium]NIN85180.1 hypothetical protein [Candidatus Aminicenantes bacterium]
MVDTQYKKGVLFLADVVNYTSQSTDLGTEKTKQFNQYFEKKIRQLTEEYKGEFIKRIGDAVLIFFKEEENFLDFVIRLKECSKTRALDCDEFFADLRMVAHYGKFSFEFFDQKISDLIGPEGIKVFRMEKYARTYDVELLITETLLDFLEDELKRKNINKAEVGKETLKGFDREVTLYKLIFPEKEDIDSSNLLWVKMAELEADTKEIPVFGDLYPAMSMENNFINLDVKTGFTLTEEENLLEKEEFDVDEMMGIERKREKEFHKGKPHRMPYVDVKKLYETQDKGIILGLPGSGKTTILKYFAYREFKHNRQRKKDEKQRLVLFIPCGNIMSYTRWYRQAFPREKESETVFNVETILNYLTHCFLFKKEEKDKKVEKDIKKAERLVHQAYHQGRLTILVDALDESLDKDVKEKIIASVKTLFLDSKEGKKEITWVYLDSDGETMVSFDALFLDPKEGKQESTRIYLTSRYSERETYFCGKNAEVLQPVFEVRPLDMEQLREMAEYFYIGKPKLFKAFDEVVWKEEIAAKVGGTPLTALLVIAYFEIFRKFDTRYFMYDVIVIFILVRVWKQVKEKNFNMDMRTFFREARSKRVLKEQKSAKEIYDALTLLSYEHMDKGRVIHEEDIIGIFQKFAKLVAVDGNAEEEAESWLEQMKADHMLISAGGGEYVFMHSTVMEYLAARYIVEKFNDPLYLEEIFENKHYIEHLAQKDPIFFQSEILPISMGSGIKNGARILRFIKNCILDIESKEIRTRFYNLAYKSLAEFESFIDRQYQRTRVELLHHDIEMEIAENRDAIEWVYQCLKSAVLIKDKRKLKKWIETFQNISRLSRPDFLEKYLDYDVFSEGGSEIVSLREDLLKKIMDEELLDNWLQKHRKVEERKFLDAEKEQIEKAGGSVLTLDSSEYNPEDKNFKYYQEYSGKELAGFLGSPNFKHNGPVTCVAGSQDGKYIVSGSSDSTVKLWERSSGKEVR